MKNKKISLKSSTELEVKRIFDKAVADDVIQIEQIIAPLFYLSQERICRDFYDAQIEDGNIPDEELSEQPNEVFIFSHKEFISLNKIKENLINLNYELALDEYLNYLEIIFEINNKIDDESLEFKAFKEIIKNKDIYLIIHTDIYEEKANLSETLLFLINATFKPKKKNLINKFLNYIPKKDIEKIKHNGIRFGVKEILGDENKELYYNLSLKHERYFEIFWRLEIAQLGDDEKYEIYKNSSSSFDEWKEIVKEIVNNNPISRLQKKIDSEY